MLHCTKPYITNEETDGRNRSYVVCQEPFWINIREKYYFPPHTININIITYLNSGTRKSNNCTKIINIFVQKWHYYCIFCRGGNILSSLQVKTSGRHVKSKSNMFQYTDLTCRVCSVKSSYRIWMQGSDTRVDTFKKPNTSGTDSIGHRRHVPSTFTNGWAQGHRE